MEGMCDLELFRVGEGEGKGGLVRLFRERMLVV